MFTTTRVFVAFSKNIQLRHHKKKKTRNLPPRYLKFQQTLNNHINSKIISTYFSGQTARNESQTLHFRNQCSIR